MAEKSQEEKPRGASTGKRRIDQVDIQLIKLLRANARESSTDLAKKLGISGSAVRRRISWLEDTGVIVKYTVLIDHKSIRPAIEAYVELSFDVSQVEDVNLQLKRAVETIPQVRVASTLAGNPDALVRLRAETPEEMRTAITLLRGLEGVTQSKTLVALGRERRVEGYADTIELPEFEP